jgi:1,4-alpha-glucan branching enzyme
MMTHPGKKLNFMGNEIGQLREWDEKREQDWDMRRYPNHDAFYRYICDLNRLYDTHASLWDSDFDPRSFLWLEVHGEEKCIYAYLRGGLCNRDLLTPEQQQTLWQDTAVNRTVTALNLSGAVVPGYRINLPCPMVLTPLIDTDTDIYGGNTPFSAAPIRSKQDAQGTDYIELDFAPYSGKLFQAVPELRKKELPPQKKKAVKPR